MYKKKTMDESKLAEISQLRVYKDSSDEGRAAWASIIRTYYVPEDILERFAGRINWELAAQEQILSEDLIERVYEKVNLNYHVWVKLFIYQKLSYEFMHSHKDCLGFRNKLVYYQVINEISRNARGAALIEFLIKEFRAGLWDDLLFTPTSGITDQAYIEAVEKAHDKRLNDSLMKYYNEGKNKPMEAIDDENYRLN